MLLDNAAAFYWPLRAAAAAPSSSSSSSSSAAAGRQQQLNLSTVAAASARALKRALKGSGAAALVTRHAVFPVHRSHPSAAASGGEGEGERDRRRGGGGGGGAREFFPASWLSVASRRADLAAAGGSVAATPRVRLTWRASAVGAGRGGGGGGGGDAAPPPPPQQQQQSLLFDLTDAGLVPLL